ISLTLLNPSIRPVGLPCASCVWNTSFGRRLAGGGGSPAPLTVDLAGLLPPACPPTSSFSTNCSFVYLFFFLHGPKGILTESVRGTQVLFPTDTVPTYKQEWNAGAVRGNPAEPSPDDSPAVCGNIHK
uniref:Uncharacterized protein n=1 Tax=Gadus morhua TaxID=8049 RepID=A0A8C5CMX8_GADMO